MSKHTNERDCLVGSKMAKSEWMFFAAIAVLNAIVLALGLSGVFAP